MSGLFSRRAVVFCLATVVLSSSALAQKGGKQTKGKMTAEDGERLIKECYKQFFAVADRSWNKKKTPFSDWLNDVLAE